MDKRLWFENSCGQERIIKNNARTWEEVNTAIDEFIARCNQTNMKPFVRYYTRIWQQADGRTRIDVGSHTEFFIWEGKYD